MIPGGGAVGLNVSDRSIAVSGVLNPAKMLKRQSFTVEGVKALWLCIKHPAKYLDSLRVVPLIQEGAPFLYERTDTVRSHPEDSFVTARCFAVVPCSLVQSSNLFQKNRVLRVPLEYPSVGLRRIGILAAPLEHLPVPVPGIRVCRFFFNDGGETLCRLFVVPSPGKDMPQFPQYLDIAWRGLKSLP